MANQPTRRPAEREAFCRCCDGVIAKGEEMITMFSYRNRGQSIHFHLKCARKLGEMANAVEA